MLYGELDSGVCVDIGVLDNGVLAVGVLPNSWDPTPREARRGGTGPLPELYCPATYALSV